MILTPLDPFRRIYCVSPSRYNRIDASQGSCCGSLSLRMKATIKKLIFLFCSLARQDLRNIVTVQGRIRRNNVK